MVRISFENVVSQFTQLSGCGVDEVNGNISIIENAWRRICALLDENKSCANSIASAEYAAAAYAFYDYVCAQHAKEKVICTLGGKASADVDYKSREESARLLRDSALEVIKPFMLGCDFLFRGVNG